MPIWLVFLLMFILYIAVIIYLGWMTSKWLLGKYSFRIKSIYIILLVLLSFSFPLGFELEMEWIEVIGAYWMATLYILFFTVPIVRIGVLLLKWTNFSREKIERYAGLFILLAMIIVMAYGTYKAYQPVVQTFDIQIENKNIEMSELNVVVAADMHFGTLSNNRHAARLVETINELKPDLVLFPGDIINDSIKVFSEQKMAATLSKIQSTYGVYASLGNHDKGDIPRLIEELEKGNMQVLYDDVEVINDSFTLIGRRDKRDQDRQSVEELMKQVDQSKPVILLDHQPYELDVAQRAGIDVMVSGHTHHGQLAPFQFFTDRIYENDWGHLQKEQLHSIVTSGFGFWGPPIRTSSQSEVVQVNIQFR